MESEDTTEIKLETAIEQFRENLIHVRELISIYSVLTHMTTPVLNSSDILRAGIVLAVSALDNFIHNITRLGMLKILQGQRPETPAYQRFQVSMETVIFNRSNPTEQQWIDWFDNLIREKHGWQSFQHPDKIAEAIRLVSEIKLWDEVANHLGMDAKTIKEQLKTIIVRRDKIAHEADNKPHKPYELGVRRWPITIALVNDTVDFIEKLAETIYKVVA